MAVFDLAEALSQAAGRDTGIDASRERIEYINIQEIHEDPNNFYSTEGIDELATNIELIGLQQPIRVRKIKSAHFSDFYRVVSGHRRLAAWKKLDLDCPDETYRRIAAIVEPDREEPDALQQLRLIFANSDTRKMTGHDLQRQAERVKELLEELKDSGYEFKGRMRDQVAKICGVSKSKLSRLDAIKNNLHGGIYGAYYQTGKIGETVAYEISKLPMAEQSNICRKLVKGWQPTAESIIQYEQARENVKASRQDPERKKAEAGRNDAEVSENEAEVSENEAEVSENEAEVSENEADQPESPVLQRPSWQTGTPPWTGPYYCKVAFPDGGEIKTTLTYTISGNWIMNTGYNIHGTCEVVGWWPLPGE